jgi:hypothetical protein
MTVLSHCVYWRLLTFFPWYLDLNLDWLQSFLGCRVSERVDLWSEIGTGLSHRALQMNRSKRSVKLLICLTQMALVICLKHNSARGVIGQCVCGAMTCKFPKLKVVVSTFSVVLLFARKHWCSRAQSGNEVWNPLVVFTVCLPLLLYWLCASSTVCYNIISTNLSKTMFLAGLLDLNQRARLVIVILLMLSICDLKKTIWSW